MLDSINGEPGHFRMEMRGGHNTNMDCRVFLNTREEENDLLGSFDLPDSGRVLDWGCGVGRHLRRVRQNHPTVHCCGIDICDFMLEYCRTNIAAPAEFVESIEELTNEEFDLIMLMGNGLGVLGNENDAEQKLECLVQTLRPGGSIVVETGNPFGDGYFSADFEIEYNGSRDGPFPWGYADQEWISNTLTRFGCRVTIRKSKAPGGMFFFAIGSPGEQDVDPNA